MENEIEYWSVKDDGDYLTSETIEEAIEEDLDYIYYEGEPQEGDTVEIYGYSKAIAKPFNNWSVLEAFLEFLDEEYHFDNEPTEPTQMMREAEKVFYESVLSEYVPTVFDMVKKVIVTYTNGEWKY